MLTCERFLKIRETVIGAIDKLSEDEANALADILEISSEVMEASNTRPAAPVEGLETVLWANRNAMKLAEKNFLWEVLVSNRENYPHYDHALVARSQAEAIIAARDAEIERLQKINAMIMGDDENAPRYTTKRLKQEVERVTQVMRGEAADREAHVKNLQADNAALTARVKELSALIDGENCTDPDKIDALFRRAETAETQLATLKDAAKSVEDWWLSEGMNHFPGAPYCIFAIRAALEAKP